MSIDASQVELFGFTGSPVTGVFQTLSCGKAGQRVPGNRGPEEVTGGGGEVVGVVVDRGGRRRRTYPWWSSNGAPTSWLDAADVDLVVAISGRLLTADVVLDTCVPESPEVEVVTCLVETARGRAFGVAHPDATVSKRALREKGRPLQQVRTGSSVFTIVARTVVFVQQQTANYSSLPPGRNLFPQVDTAKWHARSGAVKGEGYHATEIDRPVKVVGL